MANDTDIAALLKRDGVRVRALLIGQFGDFDLAEDALSAASLSALRDWRSHGLPNNPAAWLLTAARRQAISELRKRAVIDKHQHAVSSTFAQATVDEIELGAQFNDELLKLIFVCCHPSLALEAQLALTLRAVANWPLEELARAFLVSVDAIEQRLTRAKRKIREAAIAYAVPADTELTERLEGVLQVVYLIFTEGYVATRGETLLRGDMSQEALWLAQQLLELLPGSAEVRALLALFKLHQARAPARTDAAGRLVLLEEQDRTRWNRGLLDEGRRLLMQALQQHQAPGPYQIQAAIAAVHADAPRAEQTDWEQIVGLYEQLLKLSNTEVIRLNHAVAVAMWRGVEDGLVLLEPLAIPLAKYHPFYAARAGLLRRVGRSVEAAKDYMRAYELSTNDAERAFFRERMSILL